MAHLKAVPTLFPIGRTYLIEVDHQDGSYFAESDHLPRGKDHRETDALAALAEHDKAVAVWELNPSEGTMLDVSEDIARLWMSRMLADSCAAFDPADATTWPAFIALHITNDEAAAMLSEIHGRAA